MRPDELTPEPDETSSKATIKIMCRGCSRTARWNEAARAGWIADLDAHLFSFLCPVCKPTDWSDPNLTYTDPTT